MKQLLVILVLVLSHAAWAQKEIKLEDLANHTGDSITVKGRIHGVRYLQTANNTPTFINIGAAYPNQLLTVVIWGDVRKKLGYAPEEKPYHTGWAVVNGKLELYRGKPQIVIHDPKQLTFLYDEDPQLSKLSHLGKMQYRIQSLKLEQDAAIKPCRRQSIQKKERRTQIR